MKIMIADDDIVVRHILGAILGEHEVVSVASGTECLESIDNSIQVLFLDFMLGDMTGADVLAQVRTIHPATKIVMLSAHPEGEFARMGVSPDAYLEKPFTAQGVAAVLAGL